MDKVQAAHFADNVAFAFSMAIAKYSISSDKSNIFQPLTSQIMSKIFLIGLFTLIAMTSASAQKNNTWRGGTPGHETEWSYYKNWSTGRIPNEFDRVLIPDVSSSTNDYPVIEAEEIEVLSLHIQQGAMLTLRPTARLLAEELELQGTCKGCERWFLLQGSADAAAYLPNR